jgi:phospholipase C
MANGLKNIEHIVVLMMENRSFDNMLGWKHGLSENAFNLDLAGNEIGVWPRPGEPPGTDMTIPNPDPGEGFTDMNFQLFGKILPDADDRPDMSGFVRSYQAQFMVNGEPNRARDIMHCYQPGQLPATTGLADAFGISDRWHASAPCQTWPNRLFVASATAAGYVNNLPVPPEHAWDVLKRLPFEQPTIFNQFHEGFLKFDKGWRIYFHDFALNFLFAQLWKHLDHFHFYERFKRDVARGKLQSYSFIEPRYFADPLNGLMPNDSHPPHDVTLGEELIADVYNTLRSNEKVWTKTLLIVTYDEHGGCYDHYVGDLQPRSAVSPDPTAAPKPDQYGFTFDRFGVRVPTLLISPYIECGTVHRAPEDSKYPFDHTTIIKTVKECFDLKFDCLTQRDKHAPSLAGVLCDEIVNMGPERIEVPPPKISKETLDKAGAAPLNDFQRALYLAASVLPEKRRLKQRLKRLFRGVEDPVPPSVKSPEEALPHLAARVGAFLGR